MNQRGWQMWKPRQPVAQSALHGVRGGQVPLPSDCITPTQSFVKRPASGVPCEPTGKERCASIAHRFHSEPLSERALSLGTAPIHSWSSHVAPPGRIVTLWYWFCRSVAVICSRSRRGRRDQLKVSRRRCVKQNLSVVISPSRGSSRTKRAKWPWTSTRCKAEPVGIIT
jgi:hypothetical protein